MVDTSETSFVPVCRSPVDHQRKTIKRLIGLPGDWVSLPEKEEVRKIPEGHCWVEGDNCSVSRDSRAYGPVRNKFYRSLGNFHLILAAAACLCLQKKFLLGQKNV